MSNVVIIDSQIFIWGVKLKDNEKQPLDVQRARTLVNILEQKKYKIIIPAPQLAELLSGCVSDKRSELLSFITRRYQVVPFDNLTALKFGELLHNSLNDADFKEFRENNAISKARMKFDCMIVATAITRGVRCIYTHDSGLKKYAQNQVPIKMLSDVPAQLSLLTTGSGSDEN